MCRILAFLIAILSLSPLAYGDLIYSFGQSDYEVGAGELVDVSVFLTQTGDISGDPVDLSTSGLFNGAVRVFFDDNPPSDRAQVLNESDISPNPLFDDTLFGPTIELDPGISAAMSDSVDDVFAPILGNRILIGTLTFSAGQIEGEVTNLRATDFGPLDDVIAGDDDFTTLDAFIGDGFATITVSSVPEPNSMLLTGVACLLFSARRRRRL